MLQDRNGIRVHMSVLIRRLRKMLPVDGSNHLYQNLSEKGTSPAATDAAEPPEDPPGTVSKIPWIARLLEAGVFS